MTILKLLLFVVFFDVAMPKKISVSCKDEDGGDVDWFYMYKLPKHLEGNTHAVGSDGLRYIFITSSSYQNWQLSAHKVDEPHSLPARLLQPIFDDAATLLIAYNDEFPNGTTIRSGGHTKGVIATDGEKGIWLIHSVPHFPHIPKYGYPTTGELYGQSFLCLTLKGETMHSVGEQLIYNEPNIYFTRIPAMLKGKFPSFERAIAGEWRSEPPYNNLIDFKTIAGTKFKSFAKGVKYGKDLYEDWVAPTLDVNLLVETWRNGPGNLPSNCTRYDKVFNVISISEQKLQMAFKTTSDHSKWAVSQATGFKLFRWRIGGSDWICIGDINRQLHQLSRGGGTICQKNASVVELYRSLISAYEACDNK